MNDMGGMYELLMQLVNVYVLLCAAIAVGVTEGLMHITSEKVTKWKFAMPVAFVTAIVISFVILILDKPEPVLPGEAIVIMTWQEALARGILAFGVAIVCYDVFKSVIKNFKSKILTMLKSLPFMKKGD